MNVGLFTIIKNEHSYLDEWIQYHLNRNLGIDFIYIFDDPFSDSHSYICEKYKNVINKNLLDLYSKEDQNKILTRNDYKDTNMSRQVRFMYGILNYLKQNTCLDWVFYLDIDEFITLSDNSISLKPILGLYSKYDILVLSWMNFGANGYLYRPEGNVIDNYTKTCRLYAGINMSPRASSKLCFNLKRWDADRIKTNHHLPTKALWCKTNFSTKATDIVYDKVYIRHYITKSFSEFVYKLFIRGQFFGSKTLNSFFWFNPDIKIDNIEVQKILNTYRDKYYSGELRFSLF